SLILSEGPNSFVTTVSSSVGTPPSTTFHANLPSSVNLQYDGNGNLTSDGLRSFNYDAENQLINITVSSQWKVDFVYDGLGRRRIMREFPWSAGAWGSATNEVRYIYDGGLVIQESNAA